MESKVISVFYDNLCYPFKDSARKVRYPIVGNTFAGTNKTTKIRFYVDQIGGTSGISWVVLSKLPNGVTGYEPITSVGIDEELGENYVEFDLTSYYTQYKGVVKLALRGYQGEISFTESELNPGVYTISGDPLIEVTGTIDLAINYSPMVNTGTQVLPSDVDRLIGALSSYLTIANGIVVLPNTSADISDYSNGQLFYVKSDKKFYTKSTGSLVLYDMPVKKYKESITSGTTLTQLYSIIGTEPCFIQYSGGDWYIAKMNIYGSQFAFNFQSVYSLSRWDNGSSLVDGTTTLGTIFATGSNYYNPCTTSYAYELTLDSTITESGVSISISDYVAKNLTSSKFSKIIATYSNNAYRYEFIRVRFATGIYHWSCVTNGHFYYAYLSSSSPYTLTFVDYGTLAKDSQTMHYLGDLPTTTTIGELRAMMTNLCAYSFSMNYSIYFGIAKTTATQTNLSIIKVDNNGGFVNRWYIYYNGNQDSLTLGDVLSTSSQWYKPLATQDFVNTQIASAIAGLGNVFEYKGTKTVSELNTLASGLTTANIGDTYNVSDSGTLTAGNVSVVAGDNVAWAGSAWDKLAGTIDLSGYVQKTQKIANISLSGDISAQDLTDALVYATDSDINSLF